MKKIGFLLFVILLTGINISGYSMTGADRSSIIINYDSFGWTGINAGWEADECLISPDFTLDYSLHSTNRDSVGDPQYIIKPIVNDNWGEQIDNEFISNDNAQSKASAAGTTAEISEFWLTWDSNWIYVAVKGEMENQFQTVFQQSQGVNLMVLFDRIPNFGINDFSLLPSTSWNKFIFTSGFDVDFYVGAYCGWSSFTAYRQLGGIQANEEEGTATSPVDKNLATLSLDSGGANSGAYTSLSSYYNGSYEYNSLQRVWLFKFKVSLFTNFLTNRMSSITLKVAVLSVDGYSSGGAPTYDFCPNNLAGMAVDRRNVEDNYFEIPFTDTNGHILMGVKPRYDARVNFLPGSRELIIPNIQMNIGASNTMTSAVYSRKIFVPAKDENLTVSTELPAKTSLFSATIKVYNLRGELISTLVSGANWIASTSSSLVKSFAWDGTDGDGNLQPMGTYIVTFTGLLINGQEYNKMTYVSLIY